MLAIRMQRTGRKGHAEFRVVVQDARVTPSSGRVVARIGNYNPHTKSTTIDKEKVTFYLKNGAQPSPRVVKLLQNEKITLPSWVSVPSTDKKRVIKNAEKLRRNQPKEAVVEEEKAAEAEVAEVAATDETVATTEATTEESVAVPEDTAEAKTE